MAGTATALMTAMIATTTSSSTRLKPRMLALFAGTGGAFIGLLLEQSLYRALLSAAIDDCSMTYVPEQERHHTSGAAARLPWVTTASLCGPSLGRRTRTEVPRGERSPRTSSPS